MHFFKLNSHLEWVGIGSSVGYRYVISYTTAIAREPAVRLEIIEPQHPGRQLLLLAVVQTLNTSPAKFGQKRSFLSLEFVRIKLNIQRADQSSTKLKR